MSLVRISNKSNPKLNTLLCMILFVLCAFFIRYFYSPIDIPLILDGLSNTLVAINLMSGGYFLDDYDKPNSGWPIFLSIIFQWNQEQTLQTFMDIQRLISILFSSLTVIPIFLLCRKFFKDSLPYIGTLFFVFSPYLIENAYQGTNIPLFLFLTSIFLYLFFSDKISNNIISFGALGVASIIRYDSIIVVIPALLIYMHKYYKNNNHKRKIFVCIVLFVIPIIAMGTWRILNGIPDGFFSHLFSNSSLIIDQNIINEEPPESRFFLDRGIFGLIKFSAISLLPICLLFIPYGIVPLIKSKNRDYIYLVTIGVFSSIPAVYGYGRGFDDIKYIFILFPIFTIISLFFAQKIISKTRMTKIIVSILIAVILSSSIFLLEYKKTDKEYTREVVQVAKIVSELPGRINNYGEESFYVEPLSYEAIEIPFQNSFTNREFNVYRINGQSLDEIINDAKAKDLKYLAITEKTQYSNEIFYDIYIENHDHRFLKKIFDSTENFQKFRIKIFEIDYSSFELKN